MTWSGTPTCQMTLCELGGKNFTCFPATSSYNNCSSRRLEEKKRVQDILVQDLDFDIPSLDWLWLWLVLKEDTMWSENDLQNPSSRSCECEDRIKSTKCLFSPRKCLYCENPDLGRSTPMIPKRIEQLLHAYRCDLYEYLVILSRHFRGFQQVSQHVYWYFTHFFAQYSSEGSTHSVRDWCIRHQLVLSCHHLVGRLGQERYRVSMHILEEAKEEAQLE